MPIEPRQAASPRQRLAAELAELRQRLRVIEQLIDLLGQYDPDAA